VPVWQRPQTPASLAAFPASEVAAASMHEGCEVRRTALSTQTKRPQNDSPSVGGRPSPNRPASLSHAPDHRAAPSARPWAWGPRGSDGGTAQADARHVSGARSRRAARSTTTSTCAAPTCAHGHAGAPPRRPAPTQKVRSGSEGGGSVRTLTIATLAVVVVLTVVPAGSATATHFPHTKCSPSGDYCVSVKKINGVRRLRLGMLFKYFPKHEICVKKRGAASGTCHTYRTRKGSSGLWSSSIDWRKNYPFQGRGVYRVVWRTDSGPLTSLRFHVGSSSGVRQTTGSRRRPRAGSRLRPPRPLPQGPTLPL